MRLALTRVLVPTSLHMTVIVTFLPSHDTNSIASMLYLSIGNDCMPQPARACSFFVFQLQNSCHRAQCSSKILALTCGPFCSSTGRFRTLMDTSDLPPRLGTCGYRHDAHCVSWHAHVHYAFCYSHVSLLSTRWRHIVEDVLLAEDIWGVRFLLVGMKLHVT